MAKKKFAIIVDSSSGIKPNEFENVFVVPMTITKKTNGNIISYRDGVDIKSNQIFKAMEQGAIFGTASPIMGTCEELLTKVLKEYEQIYILPIPMNISGTYNQWKLLSSDYDNVFVFNPKAPSWNTRWMVMDILKMKDINEKKVTKYMNEQYPKNTMGVVIKQLKYAIRGGRISLIKGLLATALKINVILDLTVKGLEYMDKALKIDNIFPIVRDVCQEQTGYNGNNLDKLCIYTSGSKEKQSKFKTEIIKKLLVNGFAFKNVEFAELPAVISVHSGPEYVGFSLRVK